MALSAAALFLYRSTALWLWNAWMSDPYYTHGLLVAAVAVALAVLRLRRSAPVPGGAVREADLAGLPLGAGAYLAGFALHSAYFLAWSAWILLGAVALATGGLPRLRAVAPSLLLLALAIPVPFALQVGVALQAAAFWTSAHILALFGVVLATGLTTFDVGGLSFEVTPQCSGFQSAISLLAIGALVVALLPSTTPRRKALVLGAAVPLALVLNVARILTVVAIGLKYGPAAAEGFFHQWSSAAIFLLETVALLAIAGAFAKRAKKEVRDVDAA